MRRIRNIATGEFTYILPEEPIPDGWVDYPYTIGTTVEAPRYKWWLWLLIILMIAFYFLGKKSWKP